MSDFYRHGLFAIPERMEGPIRRYLEDGIPPGGFLTAVFANDLVGAFGKADSENAANLSAYAAYLYNRCPRGAWGSYERVENWCDLRRRIAAKEAQA